MVVGVAEVVVGDEILDLDAFAGHPDQMENREAVGEAAHDTVDRGKFANAVGGREHRRAANACVAIGRVGCVEFVGANDPLEAGNLLGGIIDGKGIISRHAENPVDSKLGQAGECVLGDGRVVHMVRFLMRASRFW